MGSRRHKRELRKGREEGQPWATQPTLPSQVSLALPRPLSCSPCGDWALSPANLIEAGGALAGQP